MSLKLDADWRGIAAVQGRIRNVSTLLFAFYFALQLPDQIGKAAEEGGGAEPLFVVEGGRTGEHGAGWDIAMQAGLGDGDDAVAYVAVAGDADLASEDDVLADVRGAGEADLSAEEGILGDRRAMADLH